jgi:hypothetical protein
MTRLNPAIAAGLLLCLAVAACAPKHLADKKPAPDYQVKVASSTPPNVQQICYDQQSLTTYYARMLQQELGPARTPTAAGDTRSSMAMC